jgi:hypothetical protein
MRLRLRTYSLCLACFFALIKTSLPRLALFAPAYERLVAVPMLDRTRGDRTALPLARGILEPPVERDNVEELALVLVVAVVVVAAARCAPSFAMMREREMRGFRVDGCVVIFVVVVVGGDAGARLVVGADPSSGRSELWVPLWAAVLVAVVVASAVATAAREVGLTGGGITA